MAYVFIHDNERDASNFENGRASQKRKRKGKERKKKEMKAVIFIHLMLRFRLEVWKCCLLLHIILGLLIDLLLFTCLVGFDTRLLNKSKS